MKYCMRLSIMLALMMVHGGVSNAQVYDIFDFVAEDEGPWSDIDNTTITIPMVPDGSISLDGAVSADEYGNFEGRNVSPGSPDGEIGNAWILGFANDKNWDGADDSSFTFWAAHDSDFLYIGVDAKDDEVVSNDPNPQFWKDDAIEIIVDANNNRVNFNTDQATEPLNDYGGHNYVNYEGRFSRWDEEFEEVLPGWANDVDWSYGPDGEIYGAGGEKEGGWSMEVKFHKSQFEDPDGGGPIEVGDRIGFNIGMDDDDGNDLAIQYWWANRLRPLEFTPEAFEDGETIEDYGPDDFDWVIDDTGRLSHGGTGEMIFGGLADPTAVLATITDPDERLAYVHDVLETWMGDSNFDGEFNSSDFVQVFQAGQYEDAVDGNSTWETGDWNGDKDFDSSDFVVAFQDGGFEIGPRPVVSASVPEPSSMTLLAIALLGILGIRRRK